MTHQIKAKKLNCASQVTFAVTLGSILDWYEIGMFFAWPLIDLAPFFGPMLIRGSG